MAQGSPEGFTSNLEILSDEEKKWGHLLIENGQEHIFNDWPGPGTEDDGKRKLLKQVEKLDGIYPGGLAAYYKNSVDLLGASLKGDNPYDGWNPEIPSGERLQFNTDAFTKYEQLGNEEVGYAGFVLVAGGLGERLGYPGIKVELPIELQTETCFLGWYIAYILALQERASEAQGKKVELPLAIMTSGDTHEKTVALLDRNSWFGMTKEQLTIVKQEKIPALINNEAQFAMSDKYTIVTKPHGHGDVHQLMYQDKVAEQWADKGIRWVVFFQDTNGVTPRAWQVSLGVSKAHEFAMNSITVPRKPGEALGAISLLKHNDGRELTINVEYNQLGPMLECCGKGGDVADESGFSPYPGNINLFVLHAPTYAATLEATKGAIPEFVNPKYTDGTKTTFKKPTRLECMMQEYPKLLGQDSKVGITQVDNWIAKVACKNNMKDAAAKQAKTGVAESASEAEHGLYFCNRQLLRGAGAVVEEVEPAVYNDIKCKEGAKVVLQPGFGTSFEEIKTRITGKVRISPRSTLVLDGDITLENLELDGSLVIFAAPGAKVLVKNLAVKNDGQSFERIDPDNEEIEAKYRIRGYVLKKGASKELRYLEPGNYVVDGEATTDQEAAT